MATAVSDLFERQTGIALFFIHPVAVLMIECMVQLGLVGPKLAFITRDRSGF